MHEIVIVIADLFLPGEARDCATAPGPAPAVPGIEYFGRFAQRAALANGWRSWLARWAGRGDLAGVAPARIAAAVLGTGADPVAAGAQPTLWIASPVHLSAGLSRVHLDHRGLLRLPHEQLVALARDFQATFATSGYALTPLPSGQFLLATPGIRALAAAEPARCAGADLADALPQGSAAALLRRTGAEIEMWLHGHAVNQVRARGGQPPVTALWPWGAVGSGAEPQARSDRQPAVAFATEPYVHGLWHLHGEVCRAVPASCTALLAGADAERQRALVVVEVGAQLPQSEPSSFYQALEHLDAHYLCPALRELRRGAVTSLVLIANDTCLSLRRGSGRRFWRRARAGLASLA